MTAIGLGPSDFHQPITGNQVQRILSQAETRTKQHSVAMVRHRSRRDMLKMAIEVAGKGVDIHKWAALEKTQVFPVRPLVSLVFICATVALMLLAIAALLCLLIF